ncbi:mitosis protein dim1 [Aureobasidium sp. EXF-8845]|nr:mitosis protein dim1 [Aureobasidium sp. EXF-8845]KAI4785250.1 mitosis protein dim1 [Aureobasidium sp. EXF-8846]
MSEEDRLVVIRFGRDWDKDCMRQDEVLYRIADRVKNFAVVYVCDLDQVPDFNQMYELYDPMTIMFFFRNKHMMCDFGTGNNNKLNWVLEDKQELIDIIETIYRGAKKGRGLVRRDRGAPPAAFSGKIANGLLCTNKTPPINIHGSPRTVLQTPLRKLHSISTGNMSTRQGNYLS